MKTQKLEILILFLCIFGFIGCDNKDEEGEKVTDYKEYSLTIATKKIPGVCWSDGFNYLSDVYAVKKENAQEWESLGVIDEFEFEKGYEYKVKISETNYLDYSMGNPAWTEYELLEIISKDRKDSENLPLHFIPKSYYENVQLPKYRYVVDADNNQKLIEEELKKKSFIPLDFHYMLWRSEDKFLRCIAIKDDNNTLGPCIIKNENKAPEEMPESYKLLPPEGNVFGYGKWTFLDEHGNETNYLSFDVFMGRSAKSRNVDLTPDVAYLYKDLSEYYKNKYPQAGVKTVVVSYAISIK